MLPTCGDTISSPVALWHSLSLVMESYFPPSLDLGHFEHEPRELPPGAVHPVVVGELREHRHNEDSEDEAQQPQEELLDLAVRLRGAEDFLIEHHNLKCKGNGITHCTVMLARIL